MTDYYQELFKYFQVYGTMLDIGCKGLNYLFQFDNSKFTRLIGIDIILPEYPFQKYYYFKNPKTAKLNFEYDFLLERFQHKYRIFKQNILDFQIKTGYYGFIFCKHVIHFIPHDLQLQLIDNLYLGLRNKGILFLKIDHIENRKYTDTSKFIQLPNDCYKEKLSGIIQYPCNPDRYIQILSSKYYSEDKDIKSDKSITFIIRKKNNNC